MKKFLLLLLILSIIPFEKIFFPNFKHIISFSLLTFSNFYLFSSGIFFSSFLYSISLESFNPQKIWTLPFYFAILSFITLWFKKNVNYEIYPILFLFLFISSFIFFSLLSFSSFNFLTSFIFSIFLTILFKLWKKKYLNM